MCLEFLEIVAKDNYSNKIHSSTNTVRVDKDTNKTVLEDMFLGFLGQGAKDKCLRMIHSNTYTLQVGNNTNRNFSDTMSLCLGLLEITAKGNYSDKTHSNKGIELVSKYTSKIALKDMFLEFPE